MTPDAVVALQRTVGNAAVNQSYVALTPLESPPLAALTRAFGPSMQVPAGGQIPTQAIIYLDMPGAPYIVALIAEVEQGCAA